MFDPDLIDQEQARAERDGTLKHADKIADSWDEIKASIKPDLWAAFVAEVQEARKKTIQDAARSLEARKKTIQDAARSFIDEYDHRPEFKSEPPPFKSTPPHLLPSPDSTPPAADSGLDAR